MNYTFSPSEVEMFDMGLGFGFYLQTVCLSDPF